MWLYLAVLVGLYHLLRWYRERQVVSHLQDKYVFITGCDSGFGNQLARQLDLRGLRVLAGCLTEQGAEQLRAKTSDRLETVILDVTQTESITAAAQWVKERVGDRVCASEVGIKADFLSEPFSGSLRGPHWRRIRILSAVFFRKSGATYAENEDKSIFRGLQGLWGLVNNAGVSVPTAPNEWLTKGDFMKMLDVNLLGLIEVTLSLLPLVRKARGRLVNVASVMGRLSLFGGGYCVSKYGVEAFSDSLRRELSFFGVKVAMIEPGFFKTGITDKENMIQNFQAMWKKAPPEVQEIYGEDFLASYIKLTGNTEKQCSSNLSLVTDCMEHALTACYPRTRYSAGWDAKLFYLPLSYLPTALVDTMVHLNSPRPAKAI